MAKRVKHCPHCGNDHENPRVKCAECEEDMTQVPDGLAEGDVIEGSELAPVIESNAKLIVPKKGKLFEERDGLMVGRVAVIRPCMSRGARIRGFAPIYEASMLAENAAVFGGWPMFADHALAEALAEKLQERGRSIRDLGGRLLKTWFDPELVFEDDDSFGYRKGGVVGDYVPQPFIREMLEADPGVIEASINAWPSRVRIGSPSWDRSKRGAMVEGIAKKPQGSVDWVPRGGAGGRPLNLSEQDRQLAISILESTYPSGAEGNPEEPDVKTKTKLSEMSGTEIKALSRGDLAAKLKEEGQDDLAAAIESATDDGGNGRGSGGGNGDAPAGGITQEQLTEALAEQRTEMETGFKKMLDEGTSQRLTEAQTYRTLEGVADKALAEAVGNNFPEAWAEHLRPRYSYLPSGPGDGLKIAEADLSDDDGEKVTPEDVVRERVKADITEVLKLMESAPGGAPRVTGFGPSGADPQGGGSGDGAGGKTKLREGVSGDEFTGFLRESGDLTGDAEKDEKALEEMLGLEGVS